MGHEEEPATGRTLPKRMIHSPASAVHTRRYRG
jgi:hypothetical protein